VELFTILRQLWRCRTAVAVGIVVATLAMVAMIFRVSLGLPPKLESRQYDVAAASSEVLVDSASSQVVDLGDSEAPTNVVALINRARLLANLIATSPLKDDIARRARIDVRTFIAAAPSLGSDGPNGGSIDARVADPTANIMTVDFDDSLPIITINARASQARIAIRIASAAATELGAYLASIESLQRLPGARQLVIDPLGPPRSGTSRHGPRRLIALMTGLLLFGLWCAGTVAVARRRDARHVPAAAALANGRVSASSRA
jgi:hypothetical protein